MYRGTYARDNDSEPLKVLQYSVSAFESVNSRNSAFGSISLCSLAVKPGQAVVVKLLLSANRLHSDEDACRYCGVALGR